jgi:NAD(P)-dependent dehydrogenase (short-subunit alcohol dehydrogenase family)
MPLPRAALVTGCSSGIGAATAHRLLRAGWTVWATARDVTTLEPLRAAGAHVGPLDVTDEDSRAAAVEAVLAEHGAVSALVNNAGYGEYGPVEEVSLALWRRQFETNLFGAVALTQLVLPGMRARHYGRVVNISSMGGRVTLPGGGPYHASKYALEAFTDALRLEVRNFGVRVSLVEPGPVRSPWSDRAVSSAAESSETDGPDSPGPYDQVRAELAASVAGAYQGGRFSLLSSPERVASTVTKAIQSARPRARYVVGPAARGLVGLKRVLPDPALDALFSVQFPVPKGQPG